MGDFRFASCLHCAVLDENFEKKRGLLVRFLFFLCDYFSVVYCIDMLWFPESQKFQSINFKFKTGFYAIAQKPRGLCIQ